MVLGLSSSFDCYFTMHRSLRGRGDPIAPAGTDDEALGALPFRARCDVFLSVWAVLWRIVCPSLTAHVLSGSLAATVFIGHEGKKHSPFSLWSGLI